MEEQYQTKLDIVIQYINHLLNTRYQILSHPTRYNLGEYPNCSQAILQIINYSSALAGVLKSHLKFKNEKQIIVSILQIKLCTLLVCYWTSAFLINKNEDKASLQKLTTENY